MQSNKSNTKKHIVIPLMLMVFALVSTTQRAQAQNINDSPLHWGIKGGVNVTTMYGDEVNNADVRAGFTGGLFLNYRFTRNWSIQPEVLFSMKGADLSQGVTGETGSADYEIGYLEIPVLAKYTFSTHSMVKPYLNAGPQVGFALWGDSNDRDLDDDQLKDAEFAIAAGGGVDLAVASSPDDFIQTVGLDLRYTLGLTDAFDVPGDPEARNQAFIAAITVGF
jgi:opacity protein-like surface antigen